MELQKIGKGFKYSYLINILFIAVIFIACLCNIASLQRIRVVDDEFCYWGIAATLTGHDWTDLMAASEYYSYGYSLILVPLFWLHDLGLSMAVIYRLAVILNAFFLCGIYFMVLYMLRELFEDFSDILRQIIGIFVTLYIGNTAQIGVAWTECFLCFMFWCAVVCLYWIIKKPNYRNLLGLVLSAASMFAIHMRAVGVVIAVGMVIIGFFIAQWKEINKKYIIFTVGISAFFGCMILVLKGYVSNYIYLGNAVSSPNNVQANISRVGKMLSVKGIVDLAISVIGKIYYISSATFLLAVIGALVAVIIIISSLKKKEETGQRFKWQVKEWMTLFVLLAFLAEVGIEAIFQCQSFFRVAGAVGKDDKLAYGRYADFVMGPMLILGVWSVYYLKEHYKEIVFSLLMAIGSTGVVQFFYHVLAFRKGTDTINFRFIVGSPWLAAITGGNGMDFAGYALISIAVLLLICLTRFSPKTKWHSFGAMLLLLTAVWGVLGVKGGVEYTASKANKAKLVDTVAEIIEATEKETPVYMVGQVNTEVKILQWVLADRSIHTCSLDDIDDIDDIDASRAIILSDSGDVQTVAKLSDRLDFLYDSGTISVFVDSDNEAYENIAAKSKEMAYISDYVMNDLVLANLVTELSYTNMRGELYYNYQSPDGGYITKETGIIAGDGIYEFVIDMRAIDCEQNTEIGYITVGDVNGNVQYTQGLSADDFIEKPRQDVSVLVEVKDWTEPVVGVYTYGQATIKIFGISYQKKTGNIQLDSEELAEIAAYIGEQNEKEVYYIDSDNSGLTGFPWWEYGELKYLSGRMLEYKEDFEDALYVVEKTDPNVVNAVASIMNPMYETERYIVMGDVMNGK